MSKENSTSAINDLLQSISEIDGINIGDVSNGRYSFSEYEERFAMLFIAYCRHCLRSGYYKVWKSKKSHYYVQPHGYIFLGMVAKDGRQIAITLTAEYWSKLDFAEELPQALPGNDSTTDLMHILSL